MLATTLLSACASSATTDRGAVRGSGFSSGELLQSEANRVTRNAMQANLQSLLTLADKLYRRNPAEWRKNAHSHAEAIQRVQTVLELGHEWGPLQGKRDVAALSLALSPEFAGDRVAAFIIACADTVVAAHGGRRSFHYLDDIEPQHIYNAARNMEIALWILNTRSRPDGQPLLLANEIGPDARNLSFEREFGKIIGRLDLLASYLTERYRRAAITYAQSWVAAPLLAFLPVR